MLVFKPPYLLGQRLLAEECDFGWQSAYAWKGRFKWRHAVAFLRPYYKRVGLRYSAKLLVALKRRVKRWRPVRAAWASPRTVEKRTRRLA